MWIVENVVGEYIASNALGQPYAVRSSRELHSYVSFFDDWDRAEREAFAMNELDIEEPGLEVLNAGK